MSRFKKTAKFKICMLIAISFVNLSGSYQESSGAIQIIAKNQDSLIVHQLAEFAREAQIAYDQFFAHRLRQNVRVYLAKSDEAYRKFYGWNVPEWSSGIAYTKQRIIVLKPGLYYDPVTYRRTLFHEIAHLYIEDGRSEGYLPVWLNEGTAMHLSEQVLSWEDYIAVGNALTAGKLLDLEEIESLLTFTGAQARLGYLQSLLAVNYLIDQHGKDQLRQIIVDFSRGFSVEEVFQKNLGYSFIEFDLYFYQHLKNRYRWVGFLQFDSLYLLVLVLIVFLSFFLIKMHNRKIYRKWEQEGSLDEGD